jgi:hypothetical protein
MVASTAGASQTAETSIQGRARRTLRTATRYRAVSNRAMRRPLASAGGPFTYSTLRRSAARSMLVVTGGVMKRLAAWSCGALLLATVTIAQSGAPAEDPISGTWTGSVGPGATPGYAITLDLRFDGTSAVTGSAQGQNPGDTAIVKTGMFDPQSGTLRLELQLKDAGTIATFDGVVVLGTATGRLSLSTQPGPGTFVLKRASSSTGAPAAPAPTADPNAAVAKHFAQVSGWVLKAAELVPADRYTYRPISTVRTFGQLVGHIADSLNYECGRAAGRQIEWSDRIEKGATDRATLLPTLKASIDACTAVHKSGQIDPLIANVGHTSLHYGNVVTYMRLLGLVPPSS